MRTQIPDDVAHPVRNHPGLARARARQNQERSRGGGDRLLLLWVETG